MVRHTALLLTALLALTASAASAAAQHLAPLTPLAASSPALVNRGRGARRAFVGRGSGRSRGTPSSPLPTSASSAAAFSPSARQQQSAFFDPTFPPPTFRPPTFPPPTFAPPTFAPTLPSFAAATFPQQGPQGPQGRDARFPSPTPAALVARRASTPTSFAPPRANAQPLRQAAPEAFFAQSPARPRSTAVPIVALKFNLRDDGSYSTSSETGDGTVRQEHGQFNGAAMAVQGMYAYRDSKDGPVQVNYVADEYGFQPQGPNIHPAIMQAVAEQVEAARSAKSRKGGKGVNAVLPADDEGLDYDSDNGAGTLPPPTKQRLRTVRRVVVRRPIF